MTNYPLHCFGTHVYLNLFTRIRVYPLQSFALCRIKMPETYVVHLGNSKELMEVAEDNVAKRVLREHVRESLGVRNEDIVFAIINSMISC